MTQIATLANGCFWCTEAIFQQLRGVSKVTPGYTGGQNPSPSYEDVSSGSSGHAEAAQIEFDPEQISFADLLEVFWYTHDPTTLNRQGNDVGTQYRSAIFYHDEQQRLAALESKRKLEESKYFPDPIVTQVVEFKEFFPAEDYHLNYYNTHKDQAYCQLVISPKLQKLRERFKRYLHEAG